MNVRKNYTFKKKNLKFTVKLIVGTSDVRKNFFKLIKKYEILKINI